MGKTAIDWSPSSSAVNDLDRWGFTVFEDLLSTDTCERLIGLGRNSTEPVVQGERLKEGGVAEWNYIEPNLDLFQKLLPEELLSCLTSVCGGDLYLRRQPFYKENRPGDYDDISYLWHKDRDPMQHTLMYFLDDVSESTPHTEIIKTPEWRRTNKDPRQTKLGKLELHLSRLSNDEHAKAVGSAGDVAVVRTDTVLHRAAIPKTGERRKVIFVSLSNVLQVPPEGDELFQFDEQTYREWEQALSSQQLRTLEHCTNIDGKTQQAEPAR